MRTPVKNVPDEKTRRGRRKGQAVKSYGMATARENALVAILGQDFVDHRVELVDCLIAFETCPDRACPGLRPGRTRPGRALLASCPVRDDAAPSGDDRGEDAA